MEMPSLWRTCHQEHPELPLQDPHSPRPSPPGSPSNTAMQEGQSSLFWGILSQG